MELSDLPKGKSSADEMEMGFDEVLIGTSLSDTGSLPDGLLPEGDTGILPVGLLPEGEDD